MSFLVNKFGVEAQAGGVGTELNVRKIPQASAFHSNSCTKIGVAHKVINYVTATKTEFHIIFTRVFDVYFIGKAGMEAFRWWYQSQFKKCAPG